jgi:hypothetical protein
MWHFELDRDLLYLNLKMCPKWTSKQIGTIFIINIHL